MGEHHRAGCALGKIFGLNTPQELSQILFKTSQLWNIAVCALLT